MMGKRVCEFETIEDKFNFGKYRDLTLADVLDINPSYVEWCINKCDGVDILLNYSAISQIKTAYPEIPITNQFENLCQQRIDNYWEAYNEECDQFNAAQEFKCKCNYQEDNFGRYAGSYAQDEMGYSDDDIDTIFDGDPSAYWNID